VTLLCSIIIMLRQETIPCPKFDINTPVMEHRDEEEILRIAAELKHLKDEVSKTLHIKTKSEVYDKVNNEMKLNEKEWSHKFAGVMRSEGAMSIIEKNIVFSHVYLHSKNASNSTGVVHIHIVYNAIEEDGAIKAIRAGFFEQTITLPFDGDCIPNPVLTSECAKYLANEYLKKAALWSCCSVNLLSIALERNVAKSNQHCEGATKRVKSMSCLRLAAEEPASWALERWHEQRKAGKTLVKENEMEPHIIASRKVKAARKLELPTADAVENAALNKTNMIWGTGKIGLKYENGLKAQMEDIFTCWLGSTPSNKKKFDMLDEHVKETGVGNLKGFGYIMFKDWMLGRRPQGKRIKSWVLAALCSFIDEYDNAGVEAVM